MPFRKLSSEEVTDRFVEDSDVIMATRAWAKGHISNTEFIERMTYLKDFIESTDIEYEVEGHPDEAA